MYLIACGKTQVKQKTVNLLFITYDLNKIGKLPKWHIQKKYITNEDNYIIWVRSIILLIFMSDTYIFFCICLVRDVLLLIFTSFDLWVK